MTSENKSYILTIKCQDDFGIVAAVSRALSQMGAFIMESSQFGDLGSNRFFMRIVFSHKLGLPPSQVLSDFQPVIDRFQMDARLTPRHVRPKTLLMVSQENHCLNDVLHRAANKNLPIDIRGIVSNHLTLKSMADWYEIPFHHIAVTPSSKGDSEQRLKNIIAAEHIDLVVLARYMQIFSHGLCEELYGRAINIHHSFLPSFKGARPYHQAFERGVKIVGATAHYVTSDLDEGPIIHQDVIRVSHEHEPGQIIAMGKDVECLVLARAIQLHAEQRVLLNEHKTVVFQ